MDLHVRPQKAGDGYVAYDDDGHSASGADENAALRAFHDRWPDVALQGVDIDDQPVEMVGTPIEEARHQALLNGDIEPDHHHGDVSTCMQYIAALAARIEVLERGAGVSVDGRVEPDLGNPEQVSQAEYQIAMLTQELATLKQSLATDWRKFVFEPSNCEVMIIGVLPLLRSLLQFGPTEQTMQALANWFNSLGDKRDDMFGIGSYLVGTELPTEISEAVKRVFELL